MFLETQDPYEQDDQRQLIHTRTGEPYQPARVYFQLSNLKTVQGVFEKLRCVQPSPDGQGWQWLYEQEAKKLRFTVSYNKLAKEHRPLILADILVRDEELIMDVRSFQRAAYVVEFFYKRINPRAARITRVRVVNRLFDGQVEDPANLQPPFDRFFDREDVYVPDLKALDQKLNEVTEQYEDMEERSAVLMEYLEAQAKKTLPEIEEIPVNVYEDEGAEGLTMALTFRQVEAMEHWYGNTSFTQYDALERFAEFIAGEGQS
jgi:hypothetical protein